MTFRQRDLLFHVIVEKAPIADLGQLVDAGLFQQLFAERFKLGDVNQHHDSQIATR